MVIQAISRTKEGDTMGRLIDADVLKTDLTRFYDNEVTAKQLIDEQPTIDAAPVAHGRWIKMTGMLPPEYHGHYCCSECQWHMKGLRNSWTREEELLYCPNCGARMDADE